MIDLFLEGLNMITILDSLMINNNLRIRKITNNLKLTQNNLFQMLIIEI